MDAVGSGRKQLHEGKEYDYVFDVDIKDGEPPLKLPYNANGEPLLPPNPYILLSSCRPEFRPYSLPLQKTLTRLRTGS